MPGTLDLVFVVLFAVAWPLYATLVDWPRHLRRLRAGVPRARFTLYVQTLVEQWALAAVAFWLWSRAHRPWDVLGFRPLEGWRLGVSIALVVAIAVLFVRQIQAVATRPETRQRLRARLGRLDPLVPHDRLEFRTFVALSVTAGVCEELLFRGFFIWALRPWLGWWGAGALGAVAFGLGHMYQGRSGAIRAGVAGLVMTAIYGAFGSLLPGIVLHALVDAGGGWTTWLALRDEEPPRPQPMNAITA